MLGGDRLSHWGAVAGQAQSAEHSTRCLPTCARPAPIPVGTGWLRRRRHAQTCGAGCRRCMLRRPWLRRFRRPWLRRPRLLRLWLRRCRRFRRPWLRRPWFLRLWLRAVALAVVAPAAVAPAVVAPALVAQAVVSPASVSALGPCIQCLQLSGPNPRAEWAPIGALRCMSAATTHCPATRPRTLGG